MNRTIDSINAATRLVMRCVWPGCDTSLSLERVGPLCPGHADVIHEAVELADGRYREPVEVARRIRLDEVQRILREKQHEKDSRAAKPGWIYYIHVGDRIKIGYTTNVYQRVESYPPDSRLLAVHPGTPDLEQHMHRKFAEHRAAKREWYHPAQEILDHIDRAVAQFGPPPDYTPKPKGQTIGMRSKAGVMQVAG